MTFVDQHNLQPCFKLAIATAAEPDRLDRDACADWPWKRPGWCVLFALGKLTRCLSDGDCVASVLDHETARREFPDVVSYLMRAHGLIFDPCPGDRDPQCQRAAYNRAFEVADDLAMNALIWNDADKLASRAFADMAKIEIGLEYYSDEPGRLPSTIAMLARAYGLIENEMPEVEDRS